MHFSRSLSFLDGAGSTNGDMSLGLDVSLGTLAGQKFIFNFVWFWGTRHLTSCSASDDDEQPDDCRDTERYAHAPAVVGRGPGLMLPAADGRAYASLMIVSGVL
jgi:hypothetical protein